MTEYEGCSKDDSWVKLFWQMMRERFNDDDRNKFLTFVWGRSRLPTSRETFGERKFKIQPYRARSQGADVNKFLPVTHTCFFSIEMPAYTSLDAMTDRIRYSMLNCAAIDGDSARQNEVIRTELGDAERDQSLF